MSSVGVMADNKGMVVSIGFFGLVRKKCVVNHNFAKTDRLFSNKWFIDIIIAFQNDTGTPNPVLE